MQDPASVNNGHPIEENVVRCPDNKEQVREMDCCDWERKDETKDMWLNLILCLSLWTEPFTVDKGTVWTLDVFNVGLVGL